MANRVILPMEMAALVDRLDEDELMFSLRSAARRAKLYQQPRERFSQPWLQKQETEQPERF